MNSLEIEVIAFKPYERNPLRGFVSIRIVELDLEIHDLTLHDKDGSRWIGLPGKPQIDSGRNLVMKDGKIQYLPVLKFASRAAADAFTTAVLKVLDARVPA